MGFLNRVKEVILSAVGCEAGVAVYYADKRLMEAINRKKKKKKLEPMVKEIMSEFFSDIDLDKVRLILDSILLTYVSPDAMALGHTIYWRSSSFDPCDEADMGLLMHELVHVRQFENDGKAKFACKYGIGVLSTLSYESVPYELEAKAFAKKNKKDMNEMREAHPLCREKIRRLTSSDDWDWLVWG